MKKIIAYLIVFLIAAIFLLVAHNLWQLPDWYLRNLFFVKCSLIGTIGGVLYSLRAIYRNNCVRKLWETEWEVWYYLRPITSTLSGFVSCIFLKAGLLVLDAEPGGSSFIYGYLAIAFIAGYNVDNFLKKIESIACEVWGINRSRSSDDIQEDKNEMRNNLRNP